MPVLPLYTKKIPLKARRFGIEAYNVEQTEKAKILDILLSGFNDGRKKTLFCAAVDLLDCKSSKQYSVKLSVNLIWKH